MSQRDEFIAHALRVAAASSSRAARVSAAAALAQRGSRRDRLARLPIQRALGVESLFAPGRCALADGLVALATNGPDVRSSTVLVSFTPAERDRPRELAAAAQVDVAELLRRQAFQPRGRGVPSGVVMPP